MKKILSFFIFSLVFVPFFVSAETTAEVQQKIQALLAQIKVLQAQLAEIQAQESGFCYNWNRNLRVGDEGKEVVALHTALTKEGFTYTSYRADNFTENTASVVSEFQEKYASEILTPNNLRRGTGFLGASTRAKLNKLYGCKTSTVCSNGATNYPHCNADLPVNPSKQPFIVTFPVAGAIFSVGQTYNLTWMGSDIGIKSYNVSLVQQIGNLSGIPLNLGTAYPRADGNAGTFTWTVPSTIQPGNYYIVFGAGGNGGVSKVFTITSLTSSSQPSITNVAGKAAGNFEIDAGGSVGITGKNLLGTEDTAYRTSVYVGGMACPIMQASNDLIYCTAPSSLQTGNTYDLYINTTIPSGDKATSNIVRVKVLSSVTQPSITVLSPNGGESWQTGTAQTIKWTASNDSSFDQVQIMIGNSATNIEKQLYDRVSTVGYITKNQGSFSWNIPPSLLSDFSANNYPNSFYIKINGIKNDRVGGQIIVSDKSDSYFTITSPISSQSSITVLSPNGGENYKQGDTIPLKWTTQGISSGDTLVFDILGSDKKSVRILDNGLNTGTGSIPSGDTSSLSPSQYYLRIRGANNVVTGAAIVDISDNPFTLTTNSVSQ